MKKSICQNCSISFKVTAGSKGIYCSQACHKVALSQIFKDKAAAKKAEDIKRYTENLTHCKQCSKPLQYDNRKNKFCSRSCSASYNNLHRDYNAIYSEEWKQQQSARAKANLSGAAKLATQGVVCRKITKVVSICPTCNVSFERNLSNRRKFCSQNCVKTGGYRLKSGRSQSGYYKGIYCGSTYELCWVIFSLDHNIGFTRFPGVLEGNGIKYYPDFLLEDGKTIVETKGYEDREKVDEKTKLAENFGYKVEVLYKEDLTYAFDYVSKTYSNNYQTLYDEYKPTYEYVCCNCHRKFDRDKKLKTDNVFCSRLCSGKRRSLLRKQKI